MPKPTRKQAATPITPDGLWSMKVNGLEVYLNPQDEIVGYQDVEVPYENDGGEKMYADPDGTGQGYFAAGSEPEGWVLKTRPQPQAVFAPTRGNIAGIQIVEAADGKAINLNANGYSAFGQMSKKDLFDMASEDAGLAAAHEAFVTAAHAYMVALYDFITN